MIFRRKVFAVASAAAVLTMLILCLPTPAAWGAVAREAAKQKVVVITIPAVTWKDIREASVPNIDRMVRDGAVANVSMRISNRASENYAALGAGQRVSADLAGGWAFNGYEEIENGNAAELFARRSGSNDTGEVVVVSIANLNHSNDQRAFNARPGLLGSELEDAGRSSAVIGSADHSIAALPQRLPSFAQMASSDAPEIGIHREAALIAMQGTGVVDHGVVDRSVLRPDSSAPFGISTDVDAVLTEFDESLDVADLIVVETGDTARADAYTLGLSKETRQGSRRAALARADGLIGSLTQELDKDTLVVLIAPTTPGGPTERGQLRPAIFYGADIPKGSILTSASTRRRGLISVSDVTATIAAQLGLEISNLAGHVATAAKGKDRISELVDMNTRAVTHDQLRAPLSIVAIAATVVVYALAVAYLMRGAAVPIWLHVLLLASLAFPLMSFVTRAGVWRAGSVFAGLSTIAGSVIVGVIVRRRRGIQDTLAVMAAMALFFAVDLLAGAPGQLDSLFGYTSVAGGRFFGLGNLGFALFAGSVFLTGGMIAERGRTGRIMALLVVLIGIVFIGLPRLGDDVGGTLAVVPAALVFGYRIYRKRNIPPKYWPIVLAAGVAVMLVFGLIDLVRPAPERTHLGDFLANVLAQPSAAWLVIKRKLGIAISLAIASRWGLAVPGATAVLLFLHYKKGSRWRRIMSENQGLKAGLEGLIVASILGSLLNDSGVAVAGMMLAIAAPWALIVASRLASWDTDADPARLSAA